MTDPTEFSCATEWFAKLGVDVQSAIDQLALVPISIHCWQADDVRGFEYTTSKLGGGLAVTGHYPGAARNVDELRADFEFAHSLIPGTHRLNLHASYGDFAGKRVDRDQIELEHFIG